MKSSDNPSLVDEYPFFYERRVFIVMELSHARVQAETVCSPRVSNLVHIAFFDLITVAALGGQRAGVRHYAFT